VQERRGEDVAEAFKTLERSVAEGDLPEETRKEALELLNELTGQAAKDDAPKSVLKSLGSTFRGLVDGVGSVAATTEKVWPLISSLWT
jgi:hypothetical protein